MCKVELLQRNFLSHLHIKESNIFSWLEHNTFQVSDSPWISDLRLMLLLIAQQNTTTFMTRKKLHRCFGLIRLEDLNWILIINLPYSQKIHSWLLFQMQLEIIIFWKSIEHKQLLEQKFHQSQKIQHCCIDEQLIDSNERFRICCLKIEIQKDLSCFLVIENQIMWYDSEIELTKFSKQIFDLEASQNDRMYKKAPKWCFLFIVECCFIL